MIKNFKYLILLSTIAFASCSDDNKKSQNDNPEKKQNNFLHQTPSLEVDDDPNSSPTSTPMTLVQEYLYVSDKKDSIQVQFAFDVEGMGEATVFHPELGRLTLKQIDEAASKYPEYQNDKKMTLKVHDGSITFTHDSKAINYSLQQ